MPSSIVRLWIGIFPPASSSDHRRLMGSSPMNWELDLKETMDAMTLTIEKSTPSVAGV